MCSTGGMRQAWEAEVLRAKHLGMKVSMNCI